VSTTGTARPRAGRVSTDSVRASARLGLVLRSILASPRVGFESAIEASRRRERIRVRSSEGIAPFLLSAVGGATGMVLWLKLAGMAEVRDVAPRDYATGLLAVALLSGVLIALGAQWLWSTLAARLGTAGEASARELRLVWGAAAFPQVFALVFLLPLDLAIVGPAAFTTAPMSDSLATAWAALSVALGVALAAWSAFLFVRGTQVATELGAGRITLALVAAALSVGLVGAAVAGAAASLARLSE
jgi:hypothetical protein